MAFTVGRRESLPGPIARSQALPQDRIAAIQKAIHSAEKSHMNASKVAALQGMSASLNKAPPQRRATADSTRLRSLAEILKHPTA